MNFHGQAFQGDDILINFLALNSYLLKWAKYDLHEKVDLDFRLLLRL